METAAITETSSTQPTQASASTGGSGSEPLSDKRFELNTSRALGNL